MAQVEDKLREATLKWFRYVKRRYENAQCGDVRGWLWIVSGKVEVDQSIVSEVIRQDMWQLDQLSENKTLDRRLWRKWITVVGR